MNGFVNDDETALTLASRVRHTMVDRNTVHRIRRITPR